MRELRADPVGVVLRADDPLARRDRVHLADLADRRWFQFPDGTDPVWQTYWNGGKSREGPVVLHHPGVPAGRALERHRRRGPVGARDLGDMLAVVPLVDMAPSPVVTAWKVGDHNPLIRSFVQLATAAYHS